MIYILITIEGIDGCGKATYGKRLANDIQGQYFANPDYQSATGIWLKDWLTRKKSANLGTYEAARLFAINRYEYYTYTWQTVLQTGTPVVMDRYIESNIYYTAPGLNKSEYLKYTDWVLNYEYCTLHMPKPDFTIYLDMNPKYNQDILIKRTGKTGGASTDRYESNSAYLVSVNEYGKRYFKKKDTACIIPCYNEKGLRDMNAVYHDILACVGSLPGLLIHKEDM